MAPIFASSDIADLILNFPPPQPTKHRPSLVTSPSGKTLLNSQKVFTCFQRLLEARDHGNTIRLKDLVTHLGIHNTDWILRSYDGPLCFTGDRQSIITLPAFEDITKDLQSKAESGFVELASFASFNNLALESFDDQYLDQHGLCRYPEISSSNPHFVSGREHVQDTRLRLRQMMKETGAEPIDLGHVSVLANVPIVVLRSLAAEIGDHASDAQGQFEDHGDRLVYVPLSYIAAQREEKENAYSSKLRDLESKLETDHFIHLSNESGTNSDQLQKDVCDRYKHEHQVSDSHLALLAITDSTKAIAVRSTVDEVVEDILRNLKLFVKETSHERPRTITSNLESSLSLNTQRPALARLLFNSQYRATFDATLASVCDELDYDERTRFERLFQEMVMAPLVLYADAVIGDATLRQNQDAYLSGYFRREVIPHFTETVRKERPIPTSLTAGRLRDTDQLLEQCDPTLASKDRTKTLKDIQAAVSKFAKKQKIAAPDAEQINQVKRETLQQKGKAIQNMSRGSDVLQNLIWILFAQRSEGLFVSAGKDTSRMIEQYKVVGDREVWEKLVKWRDLLKVGKAGTEDVENMKELAISVLQEMEVSVAVDETSRLNA